MVVRMLIIAMTIINSMPASLSAGSRTPREGEKEGVHYFFVSEEEFLSPEGISRGRGKRSLREDYGSR